jgi:hypothetical protein
MTFEPAGRDQWLETARECEYATFFHTPHWHRLGLAALPAGREASLAGRLPGGERFVLPLIRTGRRLGGLFSILVSGAAGCYGGPIFTGPAGETVPERLVLTVARRMHAAPLTLAGNPFAPFALRRGQHRTDFTQLLRLEGGADELFSRFSSNHRSSVGKGRKLGVRTRVAATDEDFLAYYGVYENSLERWGERATSRYSPGFFREVRRLALELPENVKLFLAEHEERIVAGALVFCWNRHAVYWHGAALSDYFSTRAPLVLQAGIIEHLRAAGFKHYDFNPSGGHEGVVRFKEGFGAQRREFVRTEIATGLYALARALRRPPPPPAGAERR